MKKRKGGKKEKETAFHDFIPKNLYFRQNYFYVRFNNC